MRAPLRTILFASTLLFIPPILSAGTWLARSQGPSLTHAISVASFALARATGAVSADAFDEVLAERPTPAPVACFAFSCTSDGATVPVVLTTAAHSKSYSYTMVSGGEHSGFSWALVDPAEDGTTSMSDGDDWHRIDRLRDRAKVATVWFRLGSREYQSTNAALVAEVRRVIEPMTALARKQGKLGGEQGRLGAQQGRLGARLGLLGGRMGALAARTAAASAEQREANDARIERERDQIEREMAAVQREMEPLGRQQEALGAQQSELGRQQERVSQQVRVELRRLFEAAVKDGRARDGDQEI